MTLLSLAERVEAAVGPDRCIDCDIFAKMRPDLRMAEKRDRDRFPDDPIRFVGGRGVLFKVPAYTASIDSAMSLVPFDWLREHEYRFGLEDETWPKPAWVARFDQLCDGGDTILATAATPALALVAASLRALAAQVPA